MEPQPAGAAFQVAEGTAVLARTPSVLRQLFDALPSEWLDTVEREAAWTPLQVLGHLVEAERHLWIPRARSILDHAESRSFPPFDRAAHLEVHRDAGAEELLGLFDSRRRESLAALEAIAPDAEALSRAGTHPEFGRVTLGQLLATWVVHDLAHSRQIFRAMAKRYRVAVGPWQSYLPVLAE